MKPIVFLLGFGLLLGCAHQNEEVKNAATDPLDSLNALIAEDPNEAALYYARANEFYARRDLVAALNDGGRAMALDSNVADYYLFIANLKVLNMQSREARDLLLKARSKFPNQLEVLLRLAELHMVVQDADRAFQYANEALKIDVYNATAYRIKGFMYKQLGDTVNCVSSFQTAVEQDPTDYDSYLQLGLLYSVPKKREALDYLNNALRLRPTSIETLYAIGLYHQNTGNARAALKAYNQIIAMNQNHRDAHYNAGFVYTELLAAHDSAAAEFTMAIGLSNENDPSAHYSRGLCYERLNKRNLAQADYQQALRINPQYDPAALGLSRLD